MKVLVDELPTSPRDCLFSKRVVLNQETTYVCTLRPYIEEADRRQDGYKPECICRHVSNCNCLKEM